MWSFWNKQNRVNISLHLLNVNYRHVNNNLLLICYMWISMMRRGLTVASIRIWITVHLKYINIRNNVLLSESSLWSERISDGVPIPAMNHLNANKNASVSMLLSRSRWMHLVVRHLKMTPLVERQGLPFVDVRWVLAVHFPPNEP